MTNSMTKEETYQYLEKHDVVFEITEHGAVYNMADLEAVELPYPDADAKNLFVRDDKRRNYYMITVKGDKRVDLKELRRKHELRPLTFASEGELVDILKLYPGAVSPLGLLCDEEHKVTLYLDEAFGEGPIGIHPNDNTATIWIQTSDLVRIIREHGNLVKLVNLEL